MSGARLATSWPSWRAWSVASLQAYYLLQQFPFVYDLVMLAEDLQIDRRTAEVSCVIRI